MLSPAARRCADRTPSVGATLRRMGQRRASAAARARGRISPRGVRVRAPASGPSKEPRARCNSLRPRVRAACPPRRRGRASARSAVRRSRRPRLEAGRTACRRAPAGRRAVRRPLGVHEAVERARPRGRAPAALALLRARRRSGRAVRRHDRQAHRRRCHGRVRRAGGVRQRHAARAARRGGRARGDARAVGRVRASARRARRRRERRSGRRRHGQFRSPHLHGDGRRGEPRLAAGRTRARRRDGDLRRRVPGVRGLRRGRPGRVGVDSRTSARRSGVEAALAARSMPRPTTC